MEIQQENFSAGGGNGKNKKIIISAIIAAVLILIGGYLAYKTYSGRNARNTSVGGNYYPPAATTTESLQNSGKTPPQPQKSASLMTGFKLYKNADFGFEIQYPDSWSVSEEDITNVRGEKTKAFYFKKPNSDLRFAILPRDGLSYGLTGAATSSEVFIGGFPGNQRKFTLPDGRRLWLLNPRYGLYGWSEDLGRIDILSGATDPAGDTAVFEKMLNSFKLNQ